MKLFGRTGGYYMFWTGAVYFAVGMYCVFVEPVVSVVIAQMIWILTLSLPFAIPPFGRWLNMNIDWDIKMFDWFKSREERAKDYGNVVKFPEVKAVPPIPEVKEPPKVDKDAKIFYRFGATDNNRVAFSMGHMEITMNKLGCQNMIEQLTVFMNQLEDDYVEEESNSDDSGTTKD